MVIVTAKKEYLKTDIPRFSAGDVVRVHQKIKEGEKSRIQIFEGIVMGRKGGSGIKALEEVYTKSLTEVKKIVDQDFSNVSSETLRKALERIFPLHSPNIAKIEIVSKGKVRTAKIYYIRDRSDNQPRYRKLKK